jgi:hypothetical protein
MMQAKEGKQKKGKIEKKLTIYNQYIGVNSTTKSNKPVNKMEKENRELFQRL